jgi:hypothetical protein
MASSFLRALLLPALLSAGCMQEASVDVTRRGNVTTVTVFRPGKAEPPCVQNLSVSQAGADIADTPPVWELSTAEPGRCRATFNYGEVPDGYAQSAAAPKLLVGSRYLVEVAGPGLLGGREFTMRAEDGSITDAPSR